MLEQKEGGDRGSMNRVPNYVIGCLNIQYTRLVQVLTAVICKLAKENTMRIVTSSLLILACTTHGLKNI